MLQNVRCPKNSLKSLNLNCHSHCDVTHTICYMLFSKHLKDVILEKKLVYGSDICNHNAFISVTAN